ncbi:hypothetical protein V1281_000810 [Nitrobacteraceae bacterium AZCC 2161]
MLDHCIGKHWRPVPAISNAACPPGAACPSGPSGPASATGSTRATGTAGSTFRTHRAHA